MPVMQVSHFLGSGHRGCEAHCYMANRVDRAKLALRIVEGIARGEPDAEALIADSFDTAIDAAEAYAYLAGFMLELLAVQEPARSVEESIARIRRLLDRGK